MADGVTIYLVERLGNQLFTYAAGLAQARRLGTPCYLNLSYYKNERPRRPYPKAYELGSFDSGVTIPESADYHRPVFLGNPSVNVARAWHLRVAPKLPSLAPPIFMERSYSYDERIQQITPGTTILGNFQSWRYFTDIAQELKDRISTLTSPSEWYLSMLDKVVPGRGSIMLHVRRGDYVLAKHQEEQGLVRRDFYARALEHLRRMGFDGTVFLASDSLDLAFAELEGLADMVPIDPPAGISPLEVVLLLSRADALVPANSSFGWWGGFVGDRPGHVVIAPRPWMTKAGVDTRDVLPKSWLTLDRD